MKSSIKQNSQHRLIQRLFILAMLVLLLLLLRVVFASAEDSSPAVALNPASHGLEAYPGPSPTPSPTPTPIMREYIEKIGEYGEGFYVTTVAAAGDLVYFTNGMTFTVASVSPSERLRIVGRLALPELAQDIYLSGDYAFVSLDSQLYVVDISDPTHPSFVTSVLMAATGQIYAYSDYLYMFSEASPYVKYQVIDVTTPANPQITMTNYHATAYSVAIAGHHMYIIAYKELIVYDLTTPSNPLEVASLAIDAGVDAFVSIVGMTAYIIDRHGVIHVIDVADPSNPLPIAEVHDFHDYAGQGYRIIVSGSHFYYFGADRFLVYDISNVQNPHLVQTQNLPWNLIRTTSHFAVNEHYLFLAAKNLGLYLFDISTPSLPVQVGMGLSSAPAETGPTVAMDDWLYVLKSNVMETVDISIPSRPQFNGKVDLPVPADVFLTVGNRLYISDENSLATYDIHGGVPILLGSLDLASYSKFPYLISGGSGIAGSQNAIYILTYDDTDQKYALSVLDLTSVDSPEVFSSIPLTEWSGWAGLHMTADEEYLFITFVGDTETESPKTYTYIIDVSTPTHPTLLSKSVDIFPLIASSVVQVDVAYLAAAAYSEMDIVDLSDPSSPQIIGVLSGIRGEIKAVENGYAVIASSDIVYIVDVNSPSSSQILDILYIPNSDYISVQYPNIYSSHFGGIDVYRFIQPDLFDVPSGGSVNSLPNDVEYVFPAQAVTQTVSMEHLVSYASAGDAPDQLKKIGREFQLRSRSTLSETLLPYTMTVRYNDVSSSEINEQSIGLYRWTDNDWIRESSGQLDIVRQEIVLTTHHFGRWTLMAEKASVLRDQQIYLPLLRRPGLDLQVFNIEVTQAVQNEANSVPLVEGRPTLVRLFVKVAGASQEVAGVHASISGYRGGNLLAGSPIELGPLIVSPNPSQYNLWNSFNALLPMEWLSGEIDLKVSIDSTHQIEEQDEANNSVTKSIIFNYVPPLSIVLVPINYTSQFGSFFPAPVDDSISEWILRTYPLHAVDIQWHEPIEIVVAAGEEPLFVMFDTVAGIKQSEGSPFSQVYYGLASITTDDGLTFQPAGIIGVGGGRVGVGLNTVEYDGGDWSGRLAAHEIGHGLNRPHTFSDPNYPYPGDSIGQYGVDISRMQLWRPTLPDGGKDFMSYSEPEWVSDYTYQALYDNQIRYGGVTAAAAATQVIMVRGQFQTNYADNLQPIYAITGTLSTLPEKSDYSVSLVQHKGEIIADYPVEAFEAIGEEYSYFVVAANLPVPAEPFDQIQLKYQNEIIATRDISHTVNDFTFQVVQDANRVAVSWNAPELPVMVRFTTNSGATWTTLGVDLVGGEFTINPTVLPGGDLHFQVVPSDVLHPADALFALGAPLPNRAPQVWISGPDSLQKDQPLLLFGNGSDQEDGVLHNLRWTLDGVAVDGDQILQVQELAPGQHTVTMTGIDADGVESTTTHTFVVELDK